jgi:hypothetical protein
MRDSLKEGEPREWEYSGVQWSTTETRELELNQLSVGNSHGKLAVEEELELCL